MKEHWTQRRPQGNCVVNREASLQRCKGVVRLLISFALTAVLNTVGQEAAEAQSFGATKKYNPGFYANVGLDATQNFSFLSGNPHIQGVMRSYNWRDLETAEGVYDFSLIQNDLDALTAAGNKRLILRVGSTANNASAGPGVPSYIHSNPIYGDAGATGGYYGVYDFPGGGWYALHESQPVRERKKALITALANTFDDHPLVEQIFGSFMGETSVAKAPSGWYQGAAGTERIRKEILSYAASEFQNTRISASINYADYELGRFANWAASQGIALTSPDLFLSYDARGSDLWPLPEGIYAKQQQLSGRVPTLSLASGGFSRGSWEQSWLYDGVNRRLPTGQDFLDFSQSDGIFATHPDPSVQGRGTNASYLISPKWVSSTFSDISSTVANFENGGGTFAKTPDIILSAGLANWGLESPGTGIKYTDWDQVGGWQSDSPATNSGIELDSSAGVSAAEGDWLGFLDADDPSVWNTTDQAIVAGSRYEATLAFRRLLNHKNTVAEVTLYYDDDGVRNTIVSETFAMNTADNNGKNTFFMWSDRAFGFDADDFPDAIGQNLGIEIANVATSNKGLLGFDEVRLERIISGTTPGDFDFDGDVDGADFLAWQRGGSPTPLSSADLALWEGNFGTTSSGAVADAVPEPTSAFLAIAATMAFLGLTTRRKTRRER